VGRSVVVRVVFGLCKTSAVGGVEALRAGGLEPVPSLDSQAPHDKRTEDSTESTSARRVQPWAVGWQAVFRFSTSAIIPMGSNSQ